MTNTKAAGADSAALVSAGNAPGGVAMDKVADNGMPSTGAFRTFDHRYYFNGKGPLPSVTTVLGVLDKPAVATWKAKEAARAVLEAYQGKKIPILDSPSDDSWLLWALKEADKIRDIAATLGSSVHLLADIVGASESDSKGFEVGEVEKPYVDAFRSFLDRYSASSIVSSEHMVWSEDGYAGTYDLIMSLPCLDHAADEHEKWGDCERQLWLIDIKTSKGYYPEMGLQLAAYGWADKIIIPNNPYPYQMPAVNRFGVLHLRPDAYPDTGWRLIEYPVTEDDYQAFIHCLRYYEWKQKGRFTKTQLKPKGD